MVKTKQKQHRSKVELDDFTKGYLVCALWSTNDESIPQGGEPLDKNYSIKDFAPEALKKMRKACAKFQTMNKVLLDQYYKKIVCREGTPQEYAGHDFWLTRCGHGAGFWDRDLGELGERLTKASNEFGECSLEVGDDKKIYILCGG